ncbi:MAG: hypothetical protein WD069_22310 [Planctomycetales bacterium]
MRPPFHAIFYTDRALGSLGLGRPNSEGKARGSVEAFHKISVPDVTPYCVANELICGELGRFLTLPIPPLSLTYSEFTGETTAIFSCLDFSWNSERLINAEPDQCVACDLRLCTGLALFDILIANPDRLPWNIKVDRPLNPTDIRVFDHEQALFGDEGEPRLSRLWDGIGISWKWGDGEHCLMEYLESGKFMPDWLHRIACIPQWFIRHCCQRMVDNGITQPEADAAVQFLTHRRATLEAIIGRNRDWFPESFWKPKAGELFQ